MQKWWNRVWSLLLLLLCMPFFMLVISAPMSLGNQLAFGLITALLLVLMGQVTSRRVRIAMALITVMTATRYLYWRITETLVTQGVLEPILSFGLLAAECYAWLVLLLSFFQTAWPLERRIVPLPQDVSKWPSVDVYIPTYNESLAVVRDTVLAAQNLDYPAAKLNVYLLDDGRRPEFKAFASQANVGYITRTDNQHAKAGNLNNALKKTAGELICIFDCDHITTRAFLQATVGTFIVDKKLALLQTPHHFYSPDPFERNLVSGKDVPHEGELFYGPIQKGNDYWNAAFFCGSCAVIRRTALESTQGFAVETVTEDAHTALKLQRQGWSTAYLGIPLAAGLATERLSLHIVQRARWARGMTQILRRDNPLLGRGLTLPQRLCYLSAMLHFQFPLARFVFLTAPLAYLLFDLNIIQASPQAVAAYVLPHLFAVVYTNAKLVGRFRYTFWNEIYETVLTFHLLGPTLITLLNPNKGKFNVTEKGGILEQSFFDFNVTRPHLVLLSLLAAGVIWGFVRLLWWNPIGEQFSVLIFNVVWASFSALFLMAAVAVGNERKQVREYVRIKLERPVVLHLTGGYTLSASTLNLSMGGMSLAALTDFPADKQIDFVEMDFDGELTLFPVHLVRQTRTVIRLRFGSLNIDQRRKLVRLVMGRADAWMKKKALPADQPIRSMWSVIRAVFGLFLQRWRERRSGGGDIRGGATSENGVAAGSLTRTSASVSLWIWRIGVVLLILVAILSTQRAWSQPLAPSVGPQTPSFNDLSQPGTLPDVGVSASGALSFDAAGSTRQREFPLLRQITTTGGQSPLLIQGNGAQAGIEFSLRSDEVASRASLRLHLRYSEAMMDGVSRLGIVLNGIAIDTLELDRFTADSFSVEIDIPPEIVVTYNTLLFSLEGQTQTQCNNLMSDDIWVEILPTSLLSVDVQSLPPTNDLAQLPKPFLDISDMERLTLPVVMPENASNTLLEAATTVASHFAIQAGFRGVDFPVHQRQIPTQHSIVIGTTEQLPASIRLPTIQGPTVLQRPNPHNTLYRLLVITGQTDQEVKMAAQFLALQQAGIEGEAVEASSQVIRPRNPYDAPLWQTLGTPIQLEHIASGSDLISEGIRPAPQRFSFRLPPDMYLWPGDDIVLDVEYEFPRGEWLNARESKLQVALNGSYLGSLPVERHSLAWEVWRLLGNDIRQQRAQLRIPQEQLYGNNELSFYFDMRVNVPDEGCDLGLPEQITPRLLAGSSLDISHAQHFALLPELAYWLNSGFPFTQWADLSHSTLLLPAAPNAAEIEAALGLVGRMGAATGYPGVGLQVSTGLSLNASLAERDILVVARADQLAQSRLNTQLSPFRMQDSGLTIEALNGWERLNLWALGQWGRSVEQARHRLGSQTLHQLLMSVRSPLDRQRNIVIATAFDDAGLQSLPSTLDQPRVSRQAVGDLVMLTPSSEVSAFQVGPRSVRGEMSWHRMVRWYAGQYIVLMLLGMIVVVLLVAWLMFGALRRRSDRRMQRDSMVSKGSRHHEQH